MRPEHGFPPRVLKHVDPSAAILLAKKRLLEHPADNASWVALMQALLAAGRIDEARVASRHVLETAPHDLSKRLEAAQLELALGASDAAIAILEEADREDRAVAALLAVAHEQARRPHVADRLREFATGSGPAGYEVWSEYFLQQLGELLRRPESRAPKHLQDLVLRDDPMGLRFAIEQWVRSDPHNPAATLALADCLLLCGEIQMVEESLAQRDMDGIWAGLVWNRLGDAALLRGDVRTARFRFRKAAVLYPEDVNAWLDLARASVVMGDEKEAARAAEFARARTNDPEVARACREFLAELRDRVPSCPPGVVGLTWWSGGGGLLEIEVAIGEGPPGSIRVTGSVGQEMVESARVAHRYLADACGLSPTRGVHVHLPRFSIHKDGGSAGLAIAAAIWMKAEGIVVDRRVGLTGELTLRGDVYPIGGLREKILAAALNGLDAVIYPLANRAELVEVPAAVRRNLSLIPIARFEQLRGLLWD